tara:strand:+ start:5624 stop:6034 length:411 start_codon:yes stop_codon:yes gene_type:complete
MVRFTQIFRTEKKEALEREVTKKSIDQMKDLDFGPAKREETEDEELRRVLGLDVEEEEGEEETVHSFTIPIDEMEFSDEDYDYEEIEAAVDPYCVENIFAFKWCTVLEKAGGGIVQVKESFKEVFDTIVSYKKNNG